MRYQDTKHTSYALRLHRSCKIRINVNQCPTTSMNCLHSIFTFFSQSPLASRGFPTRNSKASRLFTTGNSEANPSHQEGCQFHPSKKALKLLSSRSPTWPIHYGLPKRAWSTPQCLGLRQSDRISLQSKSSLWRSAHGVHPLQPVLQVCYERNQVNNEIIRSVILIIFYSKLF